jgi:hypothetical protein
MLKNLFIRENLKGKEVKKMKKFMLLGLMLLMILTLSAPASATVILDKWSMDLTGVDGLGAAFYPISNIQQIAFYGIAHSKTTDTNGNGLPDIGEYGTTDGLISATSLIDNNGAIILPGISRLGVDYEMTFNFSVDSIGVDPLTTGKTFKHLAPTEPGTSTDGRLHVWIDAFANGGVMASTATGLGYSDGVEVATFVVKTGDGGVFSPATFNGSDDATFELFWAMAGVFFDEFGNDLSVPGSALITITDSDYDADPTNLGYFSVPQPTGRPDFRVAPGSPIDQNALEDGSARLGVPEPATLLLVGSGLLGVGLFGRRRIKK